MKTKLFIPLTLLLFCIFGCKDGGEQIKVNHYVQSYMKIDKIKAYAGTKMDIILYVSGVNERYSSGDEYKNLCDKHGDNSFRRKISFDEHVTGKPAFVAHDFATVDIVSNADYSETNPAGSSLNTLTRFLSLSPYPYIQKGYKEYAWKESDEKTLFYSYFYLDGSRFSGQLYPLNKMLSELTPKDMMILGAGELRLSDEFDASQDETHPLPLAVLLFERPPTLSKTHTFTVTMTADDGKVFSNSITMTFE